MYIALSLLLTVSTSCFSLLLLSCYPSLFPFLTLILQYFLPSSPLPTFSYCTIHSPSSNFHPILKFSLSVSISTTLNTYFSPFFCFSLSHINCLCFNLFLPRRK